MSGSNSYVQVDADGVGKKVDTEDLTVSGNDVFRQRVILVPGSQPQGCQDFHAVALATTNAASVKVSPGQVYGWKIFNNAAYPIYVKLHNTAGAPTPGAGVVQTIAVQAGEAEAFFLPTGIAFATGIGISIVKGIADNDATAVAANDAVIDLFFN